MHLRSGEITLHTVQAYLITRSKVSVFAANKELRYLRALFNFGIKQGLVKTNPTQAGIHAGRKEIKYIPSKEDVAKVLLAADPDTQDYLVASRKPWPGWGRSIGLPGKMWTSTEKLLSSTPGRRKAVI